MVCLTSLSVILMGALRAISREKFAACLTLRKLCQTHITLDGQTERTSRVVEAMLRQYVSPTHDDWSEHLNMAEFAINDGSQEYVQETHILIRVKLWPAPIDLSEFANSLSCACCS